jgi:hypothetical protein
MPARVRRSRASVRIRNWRERNDTTRRGSSSFGTISRMMSKIEVRAWGKPRLPLPEAKKGSKRSTSFWPISPLVVYLR